MADLNAPISAVTVYADRALITRRGTISLAAGEHEVRINDLPLFLRDSLRASGRGPQGTRILNVDVTTAFYARPPAVEITHLQDELEGLQRQRHILQARQEALKDRQHWLKALGEQSRDFARGLAQGQMKPQDCADFFRFMSDQSAQDAESAIQLETQVQQLQLKIDAKKRELHQKEGSTRSDRLAAVITVELATEGELEIELSYLVINASWHPQYDVRVEMDESQNHGQVELTYVGIVQQSTGENWENVEMSLSTARPSLAAVLPELKPWYLNVFAPPPPPPLPPPPFSAPMAAAPTGPVHFARSMHSQAMTAEDMEATAGGAIKEEEELAGAPIDAEIATTTVERSGTALVFHVGRSVDIPSDNSPHKTTISRDDIPCEFDCVSAPALEENAHLRATITNTTERVLLSGDANIFQGGEYVGTTQIKITAPQEQFKIFLGVDNAIKIKHEAIERAVDKGNLLQGDIRRSTYGYRIKVHNYAPNQRKIVIRDHFPVPQHERIKVKLLSIQPQPTERTRLEMLTWEFTLPADGETTIEYRFAIEHPQGLRIIGLPR